MTAFLSNLDVEQPSPSDLVLVFLKHPEGNSVCWAAVQGDVILTWDGWYTLGVGHDELRVLTDVDADLESTTVVAAEQLGLAMLGTNIFPGQGSVMYYVQSQLQDKEWTPAGRELGLLRAGRIVSYLVLGPVIA